jgi:hypothetical protein
MPTSSAVLAFFGTPNAKRAGEYASMATTHPDPLWHGIRNREYLSHYSKGIVDQPQPVFQERKIQ